MRCFEDNSNGKENKDNRIVIKTMLSVFRIKKFNL